MAGRYSLTEERARRSNFCFLCLITLATVMAGFISYTFSLKSGFPSLRNLRQEEQAESLVKTLERELSSMSQLALQLKSSVEQMKEANLSTRGAQSVSVDPHSLAMLAEAIARKVQEGGVEGREAVQQTNLSQSAANPGSACVPHAELPLADALRKLPLCKSGDSPGKWATFDTWQSYSCRYRTFTVREVRQCLKKKWVHFFGDSLSRQLANEFSHKTGMNRRDWSMDKNRTTLMDTSVDAGHATAEGGGGKVPGSRKRRRRRRGRMVLGYHPDRDPLGRPRVTYLFRGKMAHQLHPMPNHTEESDLHNEFLKGMQETGADQPDFLVLSIGAHELIGWNGRAAVDLDFDKFKRDTEEYIELLKKYYTGGQVIWWKACYIFPGKVRDESYFTVQQHHEQYQNYAMARFKEEGFWVADFYQTTQTRPELLSMKDGVHYERTVHSEHARILLNMMCNES